MSQSLRGSLLLRATLATGLVLLGAGIALDAVVGADLQTQFDQALLGRARLLASTVERGPAGIELDFADLDMREFQMATGPGFLQLWADRRVVYRSPSLSEGEIELPARSVDEPVFGVSRLHGVPSRSVCLRFTPRLEADDTPELGMPPELAARSASVALVLARSSAAPQRARTHFRLVLVAVFAVCLALMGVSLFWAMGSGLAPVRHLADEIRSLSERDLSRRMATATVPEEISSLPLRLNELLGRLEAAFSRERQFSADLAHELRTPLAGLRSNLEVALSRPRSHLEYQHTLEQCAQMTGNLEGLVKNLLALARFESGQYQPDRQPLRLNELAVSSWALYAERARHRRLHIRWETVVDDTLVSDPVLLDLICRNLFDNAVEYANEGGDIVIHTGRTGRGLALRVANSGCQIDQAEAQQLAQRFCRGDGSRASTGVHCGLGLSMIHEVGRNLGGRIRILAEAGGWYEITLDLPEETQHHQGGSRTDTSVLTT